MNHLQSFAEMGLRGELVEALSKMGFTHPTDVQSQAFPLIMDGRDLMVQSRTGTGKTLAFVLPVLQRLDKAERGPRILAIAPTRELATQVGTVFARVARAMGVQVATLVGGAAYGEQIRALRGGAQIVVGTPGRLCDHLNRGTLDLSQCTTVVLDEADEILDMGFQEELETILKGLPQQRQTLLFSATLAEGIEQIARRYMHNPERLGLSSGMEASTTLVHTFYEVGKDSKYEALVNLLHVERPELTILFCHTKAETEELAQKLSVEGFRVGFLNGDLPQALRTKTLEAFRSRQITILVATDVAARGIDVKGISHIINYGVPRDVEIYIHRSGRAGRMGREGRVINLVIPSDRIKMRNIVRDAKLSAEMKAVPQAEEVRRKMRERFFEDLMMRTEAGEFGELKEFAQELVTNLDPASVVAALLQDVQAATGILAAGYDVELPKAKHTQRPEKPWREGSKKVRPRPEKPMREEGMTRLRINLGKSSHVNPGYLVRIICDASGIASASIGAISLLPHHSLVDVKAQVASDVVESLNASVDDRGRRWNVSYAE